MTAITTGIVEIRRDIYFADCWDWCELIRSSVMVEHPQCLVKTTVKGGVPTLYPSLGHQARAPEAGVAGTDVWTPPRFKNNKGKDPRNSLLRSDGNGIKPTSKLRRLPFRS